MLGFCGSWRFSWGWWCPSGVPPFWVVCGGVGWGDDNRTTTQGWRQRSRPATRGGGGAGAAAVTGLAAAGAGRAEGGWRAAPRPSVAGAARPREMPVDTEERP
ncbi:hypothetical protein UN64_20315, partial [Fictibacillus arsenicus]